MALQCELPVHVGMSCCCPPSQRSLYVVNAVLVTQPSLPRAGTGLGALESLCCQLEEQLSALAPSCTCGRPPTATTPLHLLALTAMPPAAHHLSLTTRVLVLISLRRRCFQRRGLLMRWLCATSQQKVGRVQELGAFGRACIGPCDEAASSAEPATYCSDVPVAGAVTPCQRAWCCIVCWCVLLCCVVQG